MTQMFHLGWFNDCFRCPSWNQPWAGSSEMDWMQPGFFVDMARNLERAKFDFMFFADSTDVGYAYKGTPEIYLKHAQNAPRLDPTALAPILAYATSRLGIIPTLTTSEWNPFHLARYLATVDHLSSGRIGWNIVTGGHELAAENFGTDYIGHDERYDMADEYVEVTNRLWDSWEPDAVVRDHETGFYADHSKVHPIDHKGKYFNCRGPMTMPRSPQGRPVIAQAGSSPRGREYAARHADIVVGTASSVEKMKEYRQDLHRRMAGYGRHPGEMKILFLASPTLGDTDADARERARLMALETEASFEINISARSRHFNIDLSKFDLDQPLPADLSTEGHSGILKGMIASGKTVRELFLGTASDLATPLVGSPDTVAAKMGEIMEEVGGDGFLMFNFWVTRRYIAEVTDGLVPALQRRGLTRTEYAHAHFRDNLLDF